MLVIPWAKRDCGWRKLPLRYQLAASYLVLFGIIAVVFSLFLYLGLSYTLRTLGLLRMEDHVHSLLSDIPSGLQCHCEDEPEDFRSRIGIFNLRWDLKDLMAIPVEQLSSPFYSAALLDADGRILKQSSSFEKSPSPIDPQSLLQLRIACERALQGQERPLHELRLSWEDSRSREVLMVPLAGHGRLLGFIEIRTTWAPVHWLLDRFLVLAVVGLLITIAATVALSMAIARWWSRPLEILAETARRVSRGDLAARTGLQPQGVELCEVSSTFDSMVEGLESMFSAQQRFVADASHELKTPLAAVEGQLHIIGLLEETGSDPRRGQALQTAGRELRRMDRLVTDLLLLSHTERITFDPSPFSLEEVIQEAVEAALAVHPARTVVRQGATTLDLLGEADALGRALRNLLDNALKHTPPDGRVEIQVQLESTWLKLQVADNGCGIPASHLPRIADRFYRVDQGRARSRGGTGLGLAIVKAVTEKHGGRLALESQEGHGTRATLWLPSSMVLGLDS